MCTGLKNGASIERHHVQPARVKQNVENWKLVQMGKSLLWLLKKPEINLKVTCYIMCIYRHTNLVMDQKSIMNRHLNLILPT